MADSYHTFIIHVYQTPYKKTTVKLTSSAKQLALYPVSHQDFRKTVSGWLYTSVGKMDEFLLIWVNYG